MISVGSFRGGTSPVYSLGEGELLEKCLWNPAVLLVSLVTASMRIKLWSQEDYRALEAPLDLLVVLN